MGKSVKIAYHDFISCSYHNLISSNFELHIQLNTELMPLYRDLLRFLSSTFFQTYILILMVVIFGSAWLTHVTRFVFFCYVTKWNWLKKKTNLTCLFSLKEAYHILLYLCMVMFRLFIYISNVPSKKKLHL